MAAHFHFLRHKKTGQVIDVPDKHLDDTLKRGEFEYIEPVAEYPTSVKDIPIIEEEPVVDVPNDIPNLDAPVCAICGYSAKSAKSLAIHKGLRHK